MELQDILANSEWMEGHWESGGAPGKGDFRTVMEAIQKVFPPGLENTLPNAYAKLFWLLAQTYYYLWLQKAFKQASGLFVSLNTCPLRLKTERVYEFGSWVEIASVNWRGNGFGSENGFDIADGYFSDSDFIALQDLVVENQSQPVQEIFKAIASLGKLPRYSKQGVLLLLLDMIWWGYSCFYNNADSIGEGDQEFYAYYSTTAIDLSQYYLNHPQEIPSYSSQLSFEFYPRQVLDLDFSGSGTVNSGDNPESALDFPLLIDLEFVGYIKDLVGVTDFKPDQHNDAFVLVTVNSTTNANAKTRYTLTDVGVDSDELIENPIWATTREPGNFPLGICTVSKDSTGYTPNKLINLKDDSVALSLKPGAVIGLVFDVGKLAPRTPTVAVHATTFNCYLKFEEMPEESYLEQQVTLPLV